MAHAAGGSLVAAVCAGGGFGFIGAGYMDAARLASELEIVHQRVGRTATTPRLPIGIGLLAWNLTRRHSGQHSAVAPSPTEELLDVALRARPHAVMLAYGTPDDLRLWSSYVRRKDAELAPRADTRIQLYITANSVAEAELAVDACGADVLVVQGHEAGGHGQGTAPPRDVLLQSVLQARTTWARQPPVVSAGGLSDGASIAAQIVLGADAVMLGTRFLLTPEALYSDDQKQLLLQAHGDDTVRSMAFDDARGTTEWPAGVDGRGLRSPTVDEYEAAARDARTLPVPGAEARQARYQQAVEHRDVNRIITWAGTGVGGMKDIVPAAQLVQQLYRDAGAALARARSVW